MNTRTFVRTAARNILVLTLALSAQSALAECFYNPAGKPIAPGEGGAHTGIVSDAAKRALREEILREEQDDLNQQIYQIGNILQQQAPITMSDEQFKRFVTESESQLQFLQASVERIERKISATNLERQQQQQNLQQQAQNWSM